MKRKRVRITFRMGFAAGSFVLFAAGVALMSAKPGYPILGPLHLPWREFVFLGVVAMLPGYLVGALADALYGPKSQNDGHKAASEEPLASEAEMPGDEDEPAP